MDRPDGRGAGSGGRGSERARAGLGCRTASPERPAGRPRSLPGAGARPGDSLGVEVRAPRARGTAAGERDTGVSARSPGRWSRSADPCPLPARCQPGALRGAPGREIPFLLLPGRSCEGFAGGSRLSPAHAPRARQAGAAALRVGGTQAPCPPLPPALPGAQRALLPGGPVDARDARLVWGPLSGPRPPLLGVVAAPPLAQQSGLPLPARR